MPDKRGLPYREDIQEQLLQRRAEAENYSATDGLSADMAKTLEGLDRLIASLGKP